MTIGATNHERISRPRAAAIRALQYMPGTEIDQLLADALADKETEVNLAVLASTRARKPSDVLVQALTSAAQTAQEPKVRYGSVQLLAQWKKERADVLDVIQRVASKDSEESIRTLAKSAL